jgi:uridine phosphorylase
LSSKPRGRELTACQKHRNQSLAHVRVRVEQSLCGVKRCSSTKDVLRNTREGAFYHYLPPGCEVQAPQAGVMALEAMLRQHEVPYRIGKTWTTDASYRETPAKIAARQSEGCLTVEMEAASLLAVAQFRDVGLGQILYGGDDLSGSEWDNRRWQSRREVRENLFWLAAEACVGL